MQQVNFGDVLKGQIITTLKSSNNGVTKVAIVYEVPSLGYVSVCLYRVNSDEVRCTATRSISLEKAEQYAKDWIDTDTNNIH